MEDEFICWFCNHEPVSNGELLKMKNCKFQGKLA